MSELIAKMRKFKDVKKIAWEMFERKEIVAVKFICKINNAKNYYPVTCYFPDIAKEY